MKGMKFRIKDEDGNKYEVEEVIEKATEDEEPETSTNALSDEEITALKSLAANASKILELLAVEEKEHKENPELLDEDEEEKEIEVEDEDEDEEMMNDNEEVVETCEEKMAQHDSKSSFGAVEKRRSTQDSSLVDVVADAWAKRYGGNK